MNAGGALAPRSDATPDRVGPVDAVAATPGRHAGWPRRLLPVLAAGTAAFVVVYLVVALRRVGYPYELEWMEGGVLGHVERVRAGHSLYAAPSIAFVPYLYTPLYYVLGAAATAVTGAGLPPLRAISIVASIGLLVAVGRLAWLEARRWEAGLLAAGLFAACFRLGGAWLDIAREDTLCVALLLAGLAVGRATGGSTRRAVLAGVLVTLAVLTKQVAVLPAAALAPWLWWRVDRRSGLAYAATVATGVGVTGAALAVGTGGWFLRYTVVIPQQHEVVGRFVTGFFTTDLLAALPFALTLGAVALVALWHGNRDGFWFHVAVGGSLLLTAYLARLHSGGYDNVLLPAYAEVTVLAAIGVTHLVLRPARPWVPVVAAALLAAQLGMLAYDPGAQVPTAADRRAGAAMLDALRGLPRPVYLPGHPWYAAETGSPWTAQSAAIEDVLRAHESGSDQALARQLWDAVGRQAFGAIVVDTGTGFSYLPDNLCRWYRYDHDLIDVDGSTLQPVTGTATRPGQVWLPRPTPADRDCGAIGSWTVGPPTPG